MYVGANVITLSLNRIIKWCFRIHFRDVLQMCMCSLDLSSDVHDCNVCGSCGGCVPTCRIRISSGLNYTVMHNVILVPIRYIISWCHFNH